MGFGTLTLETAGGTSIGGLPSVSNGADVHNRLLSLIHFAASTSLMSGCSSGAPIPAEDIPTKLKQLGELRDAGILTADEFEAKKADLLSRL